MLVDGSRLRAVYRALAERDVAREIDRGDPRYPCNMTFALQRIEEGIELAAYLRREYAGPLLVLDIGAGNGGVAFGIANHEKYFVVALDIAPNPTIGELRAATGIGVRQVVGAADALPFRKAVIDVVLCLETFEHLPRVRESAREMERVLRSGGQLMITTPARMRHLLRPDPHLAIKGLLLLPDKLQKIVAERWLRRGQYDVEHTFWFAASIVRLFATRARTEVLVNVPWPPPPRRPRDWWDLVRHHFWKRLRHILWNRIVIYKQ